MLSLYGKNTPPDHTPSFCARPQPPLLIHPNFQSPGSPAQLPLHVATTSIVCLTCLCSRELREGCVYSDVPLLPPASFGW